MIAIVDYGAGNLVSVKKALDFVGAECEVTSDPVKVRGATKIVLPGVGHFATTAALAESGLQSAIVDRIKEGVPFLGICVGMQWMFEGSQEAWNTRGLGTFRGECERFPATVKSPHVGWNSIEIESSSILFRGVQTPSFVYFTHSFRVPVNESTVARCDYGGKFSAAVERENIFGVQFHPEKSGDTGLKFLSNFCAL